MKGARKSPHYQSTDESTSHIDDDSGETESELTEDIHVQSEPIRASAARANANKSDKAGTWPKEVVPQSNDASIDDKSRKKTFTDKAGKFAHRAKETGSRMGASLRRRSASAGRSIRKRSRSAGRAIKAASVSAGKSVQEKSASAGREIRKRSASAGRKMRERSASAGRRVRQGSIHAGEIVKEKSIVAAQAIKAGSMSAGAKMANGSKTAGAKMAKGSKAAGARMAMGSKAAGVMMRDGSRVAARNIRDSSKSAGKAIRERSLSAVSKIRRRLSSGGRTDEGDATDGENERIGSSETDDRHVVTHSAEPPSAADGREGKWALKWQRSKMRTKVKFENAKLGIDRRLGRMPKPQCVRPTREDDRDDGDEEEEETSSRRTQVEYFEIPSRSAALGNFPSPPRIVYKECPKSNNYFSVMRNGQEVVTPDEEEVIEEEDEDEDNDGDFYSPPLEVDHVKESFMSPLVEENEDTLESGMVAVEEDGREPALETEEPVCVEPTVAVEETSREEILGDNFVSARLSVYRHRLHLKRISAAIYQNLRRGQRIGGRMDSLRATVKGRKLGVASNRRVAKTLGKFAKVAKVDSGPACGSILKDTGRCFERSAETMDELDLQIQSQFLRPLDTFLKSESKSLMPREKELSKLADKMVMAKSEGVMTQRDYDELESRFATRRDELLGSYSCILDREDDQANRLAQIAQVYTKYHVDNSVIFDATLQTLKQSLAQLEKAAVDEVIEKNTVDKSNASQTTTRSAPSSAYSAACVGAGDVDGNSDLSILRADGGGSRGVIALLGF